MAFIPHLLTKRSFVQLRSKRMATITFTRNIRERLCSFEPGDSLCNAKR